MSQQLGETRALPSPKEPHPVPPPPTPLLASSVARRRLQWEHYHSASYCVLLYSELKPWLQDLDSISCLFACFEFPCVGSSFYSEEVNIFSSIRRGQKSFFWETKVSKVFHFLASLLFRMPCMVHTIFLPINEFSPCCFCWHNKGWGK